MLSFTPTGLSVVENWKQADRQGSNSNNAANNSSHHKGHVLPTTEQQVQKPKETTVLIDNTVNHAEVQANPPSNTSIHVTSISKITFELLIYISRKS